jgi:acylphosphatase
MLKEINIIYHGNVQGVGFRYTAREFAEQYNIKGRIKNISDGTVKLTAVQEEYILNQFLEQLDSFFKNYITGKEITSTDPVAEFSDFKIMF